MSVVILAMVVVLVPCVCAFGIFRTYRRVVRMRGKKDEEGENVRNEAALMWMVERAKVVKEGIKPNKRKTVVNCQARPPTGTDNTNDNDSNA
jgi:hypothetical protein